MNKKATSFFVPLLSLNNGEVVEHADEDMPLEEKMDLFYSKSENNFGIVTNDENYDSDDHKDDNDVKEQEMQSDEKIKETRILTKKSESVIKDKKKDQINSKDSDSLLDRSENINEHLEDCDNPTNALQKALNPKGSANVETNSDTTPRSDFTSKISKKVSLEFSLPSSILDPKGLCESESCSKFGSCITDCASRTSSRQEIDNKTNDDSLDCISTISSSSSINLQDQIDLKILEGKTCGHIDFSNMRLPFVPSALLSEDLSMINVSYHLLVKHFNVFIITVNYLITGRL